MDLILSIRASATYRPSSPAGLNGPLDHAQDRHT